MYYIINTHGTDCTRYTISKREAEGWKWFLDRCYPSDNAKVVEKEGDVPIGMLKMSRTNYS